MKNKKEKSFKIMCKEIKEIAFIYKKYEAHILADKRKVFLNQNSSKEEINKMMSFVSFVDTALNSLGKKENEFIRKEFFEESEYTFWWLSNYSRSTYYRVKKRAMEHFLDFYYE